MTSAASQATENSLNKQSICRSLSKACSLMRRRASQTFGRGSTAIIGLGAFHASIAGADQVGRGRDSMGAAPTAARPAPWAVGTASINLEAGWSGLERKLRRSTRAE